MIKDDIPGRVNNEDPEVSARGEKKKVKNLEIDSSIIKKPDDESEDEEEEEEDAESLQKMFNVEAEDLH